MSKAILVVDMPKTCLECPLMWKEEKNINRCFATQDQITLDSIVEECPLIEVDKAHSRAGNWLLPKGLFDEMWEEEE